MMVLVTTSNHAVRTIKNVVLTKVIVIVTSNALVILSVVKIIVHHILDWEWIAVKNQVISLAQQFTMNGLHRLRLILAGPRFEIRTSDLLICVKDLNALLTEPSFYS